MIESTALATMDDIRDYCREVKLPCSETKIIQMHGEEGFPLKKLGDQWESDKNLINAWRKDRIVQRRIDMSYIEERNQFIPKAEEYADRMHGNAPPRVTAKGRSAGDKKPAEKWAEDWSLAFHAEMDRLWLEHVQRKKIAYAYANEQARKIYAEKLEELMGRTENGTDHE